LRNAAGLPLVNKAFTDEDLALVSSAVLAACDGLDGAADGLVQHFTGCTTDVVLPRLRQATCQGAKTATCLSAGQVGALTTVFNGARTPAGDPIYATRPWDAGIGGKSGAAFYQGWRTWKLGPYAAASNTSLDLTLSTTALASIFFTPPATISTTGGDQVAFGLTLDLAQAQRALAATSGAYRESALQFMKADATDLSAFRKRGGKLVIVHGVSDPVFSINDTIAWWTDVDRAANGRAADFVRLFAVPGMNHCAGGPATDQFNAFAALVDWVEKDTAPDRITATARAATPWPGRTRPLCPYPQVARYSGSGSLEDAANFVCR
jgi:feruloyl esterase